MPGPARGAIVRKICARASTWRFVSAPLLADLAESLEPAEKRALGAIARVSACEISLPDVRSASARRRAAHAGRPLWVCVAQLVPYKRVDAAIDHVARTEKTAVLVVVGDGPERARLEEHAR